MPPTQKQTMNTRVFPAKYVSEVSLAERIDAVRSGRKVRVAPE